MERNNKKVRKFKAKKPRSKKNARVTYINCPNCMSRLVLNAHKTWECSGDKLKLWEEEFIAFGKLTEEERGKYLVNISNYGTFMDLYDKWKYSQEKNAPEEYNCGYTNVVYPISGTASIRIPDPLIVKKLEYKLGRALTEEEILGESELWFYAGRVLTKWRKKAKQIKIPFIVLPSEETIYV